MADNFDSWPVYSSDAKPWYEDIMPSNKTATDFAGNFAASAAMGGAKGRGMGDLALDIGKAMAISKGIGYAKDKVGGWLAPAAAGGEVASPLAGGTAETVIPDVAAGLPATATTAAGGAAPGMMASIAPVAAPAAAFLLASMLFKKIGSGGGEHRADDWSKAWRDKQRKHIYGE